jgi:glycogen synthase
MKVAMLGWEFPPFMAGGLGIHCLELTRNLARMGVAIDFYMPHMQALEGDLRVAQHHGHLRIVEVEAQPGTSPYGSTPANGDRRARYERDFNAAVALYNERLVAAFDSHDADLLHCHDWITVPAALELKRRTGLPLVFSVHSTEFDRSANFAPQTWIEDIERRGVLGADLVIAVSRYTKELVERLYGADPGKVRAVHNGVDLGQFHGPDGRDYNACRDGGRVLFLSRVSRQKGPLFFMEVARRVLERRPASRFVVAGKGDMLGECIQFAVRHRIHDRVEFMGFVPNEELADVYDQSDVYVLPSVSEPFGISVLEAMGSGVPTIVSRSSGVGEAVSHVLKAESWDTEEMADMVVRLLDSPELRAELGRNGAKEARRFTWESCARRTLDVYRDAVASVPRPAGQVAVTAAERAEAVAVAARSNRPDAVVVPA